MSETETTAAVTDRLHRIAEAMDAADHPTLTELFGHARLVDGRSGTVLAHGGDAAVAHFGRLVKVHPDGTWRTKHVTTNAIVELDEDGASCRSVYTVFQQTPDLPLQAIIVGRYHDRFETIDGRWELTERRYFADLVGDLGDHLLIELRGGR